MAETNDLLEKFTVNLSQAQKYHLVPFCATCLVYFTLYMPFWGYPPETLGSVFFKILPIFSLYFYVTCASKEFKGSITKKEDLIPKENRSGYFQMALLFSSLGDACLVWRKLLFVPGLLSFAVAQGMYFKGLEEDAKASRTKTLFILLGLSVFMFLKDGIDSYILTVLVGLYLTLIFAMGWRATARYEAEESKAAFLGCIGALLFIFSDFIIAVDKWCFMVPCASFLIMTSYYVAQLCLALSTTKDLQ
ncbi:Lysoplasmalogenase-like protein tmem86a [Mactra antiquata]